MKNKATIQLKDTNGKMDLKKQQKYDHCYFKSIPTQKVYTERIIKILTESVKFNATRQIFANQSRIVLKERSFSEV